MAATTTERPARDTTKQVRLYNSLVSFGLGDREGNLGWKKDQDEDEDEDEGEEEEREKGKKGRGNR